MAKLSKTDLINELRNLKANYRLELLSMTRRVEDATAKSEAGKFSSHDAFNMAATCQNLAVLAGQIQQAENVVRWMGEMEVL